jgi:uncharacterized protein YqfA (UPF0365 family)
MCWFLVVVVVAVLVGVEQLYQLLLLHLAAAVAALGEELNCGYLLYLLAPLRQSQLALVVLALLLKQQTTLLALEVETGQSHPLVRGRLQDLATALVAAQRQLELPQLVAGV